MTDYSRSVYCERLAVRDLRVDGYEALRSAGSHPVVDVIAWNNTTTRFIQVKSSNHISGDERCALEALVVPTNASVEVWMRVGSANTKYWRKEVFDGSSRSWYAT